MHETLRKGNEKLEIKLLQGKTSETTLSLAEQAKATEKWQKNRKAKFTRKSDDDRIKGSLIFSEMQEIQYQMRK